MTFARLFPHGTDLGAAVFLDWQQVQQPMLLALARMVGSSSLAARLGLLLCAAVSPTWPDVALPLPGVAALILSLCSDIDRVAADCTHCQGPLGSMPMEALACIMRATGCTFPDTGGTCPVALLRWASSVPTVIAEPAVRCGVIFDAVLPGAPGPDERLVTIATEQMHRPVSRFCLLCCVCVGSRTWTVQLTDTAVAAQQMPVAFAALRAALLASLPRKALRHWPQVLCHPRRVHEPDRASARVDQLRMAFTEQETAQRWLACSEEELTGATTTEQAAEQHASLLPLLAAARSSAVQRVLRMVQRPQPDLREPMCAVYALISPLWGKCYVGAVGFRQPRPPIKRWREHVTRAQLWQSRTSSCHFSGRAPPLYAAMAAVSPRNVCLVILERTVPVLLARRERAYIRALEPVFNSVGISGEVRPWGRAALALRAASCDDVFTLADRLLRRAHPKLAPSAWVGLVTALSAAGYRTMAVKTARLARTTCPRLRSLRALPHLTVPCPVPQCLLDLLSDMVSQSLRRLPVFERLPQFMVTIRVGRAIWARSPMVDTVVAPSCPPMHQIGLCQCHGGAYQGHVLTRDWERLPACGELRRLVGARCMAQRTYPRVDHVVGTVQARITQYLVACGYATDLAQREASTVTGVFRGRLATWLGSLPPYLQQSRVRAALQPMWAAGLVAVRIDRNPGRVVVMCVEAWKRLNAQCFTECPRYQHTRRVPATDDADYAKCEVRGFREWMMPAGESITFATVPRATRPYGYWVVKQKSRLREGG